jgi:hypothetical protein
MVALRAPMGTQWATTRCWHSEFEFIAIGDDADDHHAVCAARSAQHRSDQLCPV